MTEAYTKQEINNMIEQLRSIRVNGKQPFRVNWHADLFSAYYTVHLDTSVGTPVLEFLRAPEDEPVEGQA